MTWVEWAEPFLGDAGDWFCVFQAADCPAQSGRPGFAHESSSQCRPRGRRRTLGSEQKMHAS